MKIIINRIYLTLLMSIMLSAFAFAQTSDSLTITTYYPAPYGEYKSIRLYPNANPPDCAGNPQAFEGTLHYDNGSGGLSAGEGLYYCGEVGSNNFNWQFIGAAGLWTLVNNQYLHPNGLNWKVGIGTTQPKTALHVIGAISRQGTTLYGIYSKTFVSDSRRSLVNLGVNSTTGEINQHQWGCTVSGGLNNTAKGSVGTPVVSGGKDNIAWGSSSNVAGGENNVMTSVASISIIAGGKDNIVANQEALISGGRGNRAGFGSAILGGYNNLARSYTPTVAGGADNVADGNDSFAAGRGARTQRFVSSVWILTSGAFVWADSLQSPPDTYCGSNGANTFNVCAQGGAYLQTATPPPPPQDFHAYDIAEFMEVLKEEGVGEAELVALKENHKLGKTTSAYDKNLVGVISGKKTTTLHLGNTEPSFKDTQRKPVALAGPVYVKVNSQNGNIIVGDPITSSSTLGIGMKASKTGKIIGYAMQTEEFKDANEAEILVFLKVGYYLPEKALKELEEVEALEKELKEIKQQLAQLKQ